MKKNKKLLLLVLVLSMVLVTACGGNDTGGGETEGEEKLAKEEVIFGTAGTAGTYYVVGAAMGNEISKNSDALEVVVQSTNGSMEKINLTNIGEIQFGMSNSDGVYHAYNGVGTYEEAGKQNIKGLMSLYMSAGHMVVKADSGINSFADLKGKKVGLGPPSTTIIEMSKAVLRENDIDPDEDINPSYLSFDEGLTKLTDGDIDATFFVAGTPTAALMNAASNQDLKLLEVSDAVAEKIVSEHPYYEPHIIPGGTYKGIDEDVKTLKLMTNIFVNADVEDDIAYEFVKTAMENLDAYKDAHTSAAEINIEEVYKTPIDLHPGAAKYYKEVGVLE